MHVVNAIKVYRCEDCKRIITDTEIAKLGCCPSCKGRRVRGATPNKWETFKLSIKLLFMRNI